MTMLNSRAGRMVGVVMLGLLLALSGQSFAQDATDGLQGKRQELRELQETLSEIRQTAMADHPELQRQQDALQTQVMSRMRDAGVEPRKSIRRLQDITRELRSGEAAEEDQAALMQEYQETREAVLTARREALDDDGVREAQKALQSDLVDAMSEQEAAVPEMIERFEALREEVTRSQSRLEMGTQR